MVKKMNNNTNILLIGLGNMGISIAQRLIEKGYNVYGFDIDKKRIEAAHKLGVHIDRSIEEAINLSSTIITVLPDQFSVKKIYDDNKLLKSLTCNHIILDFTTSDPKISQDIGTMLKEKKVDFLDVGVLGNPTSALAGTLALFVGGEESSFNKAKILFSDLAKYTCHIGKLGDAHVAKLAANELFLAQVAAVAESLALLKIYGLDIVKFLDTLAIVGGRGAGLADIGKSMLVLSNPPVFNITLAFKDLNLLSKVANKLGIFPHLTSCLKTLYKKASDTYPNSNFTIIHESIHDNFQQLIQPK